MRPELLNRAISFDLSAAWIKRLSGFAGWFLFAGCREDPELERHARLITWFGILGFLFCMGYAMFYWMIDHLWGMRIIAASSLASLLVPFLMKWTRSLAFGGHLLMAIMTLEFLALCSVEGGLHGHAFAWLAVIPLCALLLLGRKEAGVWALISILAGAAVCIAALNGVYLPVTYAPHWENLVSSIGYLGLVLFMFLLGLIFEIGREKALGKVSLGVASLEVSNKKLMELNQEKNEFLGIAAHDLKNPLTGIIGAAELLKIIQDPVEVKEVAGEIIAAGKRMRDLIGNLLDSDAIEEGRFVSLIGRCDLHELAQQSIKNNTGHAGRKQIRLELKSETGLWATADPNATVQILDNLISNAVKYAPLRSRVLISCSSEQNRVLVSVTDEGPGLSAGDQSLLFRKFTRLSAKPTGGESSNGLGLAIVKRLVEAMKGSVECRSVLGSGSTFLVYLPSSETKTSIM